MLPARRPRCRNASTPEYGRPAGSWSRGNAQMLFGGMGRLSESSVAQHQEQVATRSPPRSRCRTTVPRGVIVAQGGKHWRLEPLCHERQAEATATTSSASSSSSPRADRPYRPASIRCAWSSRMTAAALRRAGRFRSTSMATKVGEGRVEPTVPMLFSADETLRCRHGQSHRRSRR